MREQILSIIEKNSRIDLKELAVILGVEEIGHTEDNPGRGCSDVLRRMTLSPPVPPAEVLKDSYNIM